VEATEPVDPEHALPLDAPTLSKLRHDLRDPLGAVLGFTELLIERQDPGNRATLGTLQHIESAARRMLSILGGPVVPSIAPVLEEVPTGALPDPRCGTLLVIDDEPGWRSMLAAVFEAKGYCVLQASDGIEGERILHREKVDAVLLDMSMPAMSGLDVLEKLRAQWQPNELPVVIVTGQADQRTIVAALDRGANDYVTKGVTDVSVINARVRNQVSLKRAGDRVNELNAQLQAAHEKIGQLADSSGEALQNIPAWAASVANDLAEGIRAEEIAVWALQQGLPVALTDTKRRPPTEAELDGAQRERRILVSADVTVVSVAGMVGRVCGGLMVWGKRGAWSEAERQLIIAFAFQLGGAMELKEVRVALAVERSAHEAKHITLARLCPLCARCFDDTLSECPFDGTGLMVRPFPYTVADKFRLIRLLGRGGMGEVYQAYDQSLRRHVAVKIIKPEHSGPDVRKRFEREATILAAIDSPYVVRIYDVGELPGGSAYFVTEILRGADVRRLVDTHGAGRPGQIARLVRDASRGLAAVHARDIIHRDIKPANIFLLDDEAGSFSAKVIDFGIARNVTDLTTTISHLVGTPSYMSAEQLGAQALTAKTDVYSLATVVWESLAGRRLVRSTDLITIMYEVISGPTRRLSSLLGQIPAELDEIIAAALSAEAGKRPDIEEWGERLATLLETLPTRVPGWPSPLPAMAIEADEADTVGERTIARPRVENDTTQFDLARAATEDAS
jgi:DNA-binding response OmpR family regulator